MMTELYLEQVLIGALGVTIALVPWLAEIRNELQGVDVEVAIAIGSAAVGVAFWLGIPLDRLADTLTDRLDRHARLRFALKRAKGIVLNAATENSDTLDRDLFEEDRFRISALRDSEAAVKWMDYHRSRIRLTRALAVYGPALAVSLTIGLPRVREVQPEPVNRQWLIAIAAGYAIWAILARVRGQLPRTNQVAVRAYAQRWGFVEPNNARIANIDPPDALVWASELPALAVPLLLMAAALVLALSRDDRVAQITSVAVALTTIVSAWAWWRIGFTFRTYLADLEKYRNKPAARS